MKQTLLRVIGCEHKEMQVPGEVTEKLLFCTSVKLARGSKNDYTEPEPYNVRSNKHGTSTNIKISGI